MALVSSSGTDTLSNCSSLHANTVRQTRRLVARLHAAREIISFEGLASQSKVLEDVTATVERELHFC